MLALPVKLLTSVFAVALFSQCYDVYTTEYELHRVRTEKAVLYLTTEVCADPLVHAKLEEFNRCFDSRVILRTSPAETALRYVLSNMPSVIMSNLPVFFLAKAATAGFVMWFASSWLSYLGSTTSNTKQKTM